MNRLHSLLRWLNLHPSRHLPRVKVWGNRLRAPTFDRWLALALHRMRLMGVSDHGFLSREVRPGMTVVDIGANQGLYSLLFKNLVGGNGLVFAFEPDDMLYAALQNNVNCNNAANIRTHHVALGSAPGTMTLYRSLLNSGDNRLAQKTVSNPLREAVHIRVERLDKILAGIPIDFIKMDVQGWEMEVFRGMEGILDDPSNARLSIYFEYWPQGLRDAGSDPYAPLAFLQDRGFSLHRTEKGRSASPIDSFDKLANEIKTDAYINLHAVRIRDVNCSGFGSMPRRNNSVGAHD